MQNISQPGFLSLHCDMRMQSRKISPFAIGVTIKYGTRVRQRNGRIAVMLLNKDIPEAIGHAEVGRIAGTVVIVSQDDRLITAYRRHELRPIQYRKRMH
jgi:hypothetical protein